jgi:hypothetical protein
MWLKTLAKISFLTHLSSYAYNGAFRKEEILMQFNIAVKFNIAKIYRINLILTRIGLHI